MYKYDTTKKYIYFSLVNELINYLTYLFLSVHLHSHTFLRNAPSFRHLAQHVAWLKAHGRTA